jgi:hypothetical protein
VNLQPKHANKMDLWIKFSASCLNERNGVIDFMVKGGPVAAAAMHLY